MVDRALLARFGPNGFLKARFRALGEIEKWSKKSPLILAKHKMKWGGLGFEEIMMIINHVTEGMYDQ